MVLKFSDPIFRWVSITDNSTQRCSRWEAFARCKIFSSRILSYNFFSLFHRKRLENEGEIDSFIKDWEIFQIRTTINPSLFLNFCLMIRWNGRKEMRFFLQGEIPIVWDLRDRNPICQKYSLKISIDLRPSFPAISYQIEIRQFFVD